MSLLVLGLFFVALFLIPMRYSNADTLNTRTETFSSSSDMDSPPGTTEYERKVERFHGSDADVAPPAESDQYEYKSEHRESTVVAPPPPPPAVVEHDRTIVEHDAPPPPREGRVQAWWHRNFHRDTD